MSLPPSFSPRTAADLADGIVTDVGTRRASEDHTVLERKGVLRLVKGSPEADGHVGQFQQQLGHLVRRHGLIPSLRCRQLCGPKWPARKGEGGRSYPAGFGSSAGPG